MIQFFRKIRHRLLRENKFTRYLEILENGKCVAKYEGIEHDYLIIGNNIPS